MDDLTMTMDELKGLVRLSSQLRSIPEEDLPMLVVMLDSFVSGLNYARAEATSHKRGRPPKAAEGKKGEDENAPC